MKPTKMITWICSLGLHSPIVTKIIPSASQSISRSLMNCGSVLDLGCGPSSPLQYAKNIKYSVGVEVFGPYVEKSKKANIHSKYLQKKFDELEFEEGSFDAVILIEVVEHMKKKDGLRLLEKAERWARKKIVLTTPNGYMPMPPSDGNSHQEHLSGWDVDELKNMGFEVSGLAGLKLMRTEQVPETSAVNPDLFVNIKYSPKPLFFVISALSQAIVYYFPQIAYGLFAEKKLSPKKQSGC